MNLNNLMEARLAALQDREDAERSSDYVHISEPCAWRAFWNRVRGHQASSFDIKQSSKTAGGEMLEDINLRLFLADSDYKLATHGGKELRDTHADDKKSPTFVYDPEYDLGGRCDAVVSCKRSWSVFESKTCNQRLEDILYELWFRGYDIAQFLAERPYAAWWTWGWISQGLGYIHSASVTFKRNIRKVIFSILGKDTLMPFRFEIDLDDKRPCPLTGETWGEYWQNELKNLLFKAKLIKEGREMGYENPPEQLFKAANKKFCTDCFYLKECKPEFEKLEQAQDVTARMPELGLALDDFYEYKGGKKAEDDARTKLKDRVAPLFEEVPDKSGDKFKLSVRFGESLVTATYSYVDPQVKELTPAEKKSGEVVTRNGYTKLVVNAKKVKEE